mgnify:CR=1 FL=1
MPCAQAPALIHTIVVAAGVGGDGEHQVAAIGEQTRAGGEEDIALLADGIHGAVTFGRIPCIEEQGIGGLVAFQIQNAQRLAGLELL